MKIYKKVLISVGFVIVDFLVTYYFLRLAIYLGWTQERFVDKWTIVLLMIFGTPFAIGTVLVVLFYLFRFFRNIYIGIRYGMKYADRDDDDF